MYDWLGLFLMGPNMIGGQARVSRLRNVTLQRTYKCRLQAFKHYCLTTEVKIKMWRHIALSHATACLACFICIALIQESRAVAKPGSAFSRKSRDRQISSVQAFDTSPKVDYRLHVFLFTPRIPDLQYRAYINELPNTLRRLGYQSAQVTPIALDFTAFLKIQSIVRAQMAQHSSRKQFLPILFNPRVYGRGRLTKVYAMPLDGRSYTKEGIRDYAGSNGKQKLAILGTVLDLHTHIQPPIVELYGVAEVTGAAKLLADLKSKSTQGQELHNLEQFLDLDKIASGTPQVPVAVLAEASRGIPIH